MIASLIKLPNFYTVENGVSSIQGYSEAHTGENDDGVYLPFSMVVMNGRNLTMPSKSHPVHKYKLECIFGLSPWDVVFASTEDLPPFALGSVNYTGARIIPLYARNLASGQTIMFVDRINELFSSTSVTASPVDYTRVMSVMSYINTILYAAGNSYLASQNDGSMSPIACDEILIALISTLTCDGADLIEPVRYYQTHYSVNLPQDINYEIQCIKNAVFLGQIIHLYNPGARTPMSAMVLSGSDDWSSIGKHLGAKGCLLIRSTDNILPVTPEEPSSMGTFLGDLMSIPGNDFKFNIRTDERDVSDFYYSNIDTRDGFHKHNRMLRSWQSLMVYMVQACNLGAGSFATRELTAHRSCMEDLTVYDKNTGEVMLYIDLVWWSLAAASGLINSGNTAPF